MRSRLIFTVILIIVFIFSGILIYINNVILPVKLKSEIVQKLQKNLGKDVRIEKIRYSIFKGLIIQNLSVFDGSKDKTYLEVKEISFNFPILPLLQKKIIIPLLNIDSPQIYLKLRQDNTLNILDVFKREKIEKEKLKFAVFIYKINISDGKCQFRDEHMVPNYIKEIANLKIGLAINFPAQIKFILQAKILNAEANPSLVSALGEYDILKQELQGQAKINNVILKDYNSYFDRLAFSASKGITDANLEVSFRKNQLMAKGIVNNKGLELKKDRFLLAGDLDFEPEVKYDFANKDLKFKGNIRILHALFSGLDYIKDISDIQGNVYVEGNKAWTDGLKAQVLGSPLDFKGLAIFSQDQLKWDSVSFNYRQSQYDSSGNLMDFKQPKIDFNLAAKDFDLKSSVSIEDKLIKITSCLAKFLGSEFDIKGSIDTKDNTNPKLDFNLALALNLKDNIGLLPPKLRDNLEKFKLDGDCKIKGSLAGALKDLKGLNTRLAFSSEHLSVYDLKLSNLGFTLEQKDGLININDLSASLYSGNVKLKLQMNLTPEVPEYTSKITFSNVDLAKLRPDTILKDKDISGILNLRLDLQGKALRQEDLLGEGYVSIKNGRLWELNLFKGLGEFLFIPLYQKIVFKEADANFGIKNKNIEIANSFLSSENLDLTCEGKVGFNGALDITMNSQINEELTRESPDLRKFTSAVFGNMLVIKVGGTVQKPKYRVVPVTREIIGQIKRFFLGR